VTAVLFLVYGALDRMDLTDKVQKEFRDSLIENHLTKFDYELNSKEYLVAAVLNVEIADEYKNRSFSKIYYEAGIESIYEVLTMYENETSTIKNHKPTTNVERLTTELGVGKAQVNILKTFSKLTKKRSETILFIERFFSFTGNINNKTRSNMSDELLEMQALLKVNIELLEQILN
jgi:hypothetical protein